ncbi:MAG: metallophosphoesterase [Alphaproteobacteria bacterium]|nr:metallophosphoesterase [Alphaproteobacteria bacterium]
MRIAQISDTHISLSVPSRALDLQRCVDQVNALDPLPEVVIHSGDVAHDGLVEEYEIAKRLLQRLKAPLLVLPGNKDNREVFVEAFSGPAIPRNGFPFVQYAVDDYSVRIVCVDTLSAGSNKGDVCEDRRDDLEGLLAAGGAKPTVIFMHHPPFDVPGIPDPFQFLSRANAEATLAVIGRHRPVLGLFCGHIHRPFRTEVAGMPARVMTAGALDLRKGRQERSSVETRLFEVHDFD